SCVDGEPSATVERPPSIREFDPVARHTVASKSKLLQARINAMEREKGTSGVPAAVPQPVINVVLPDNIYGRVNARAAHSASGSQPVDGAAAPSTGLIPSGCEEGPNLDITTFCAIYNLPPSFLQKFHLGAITGTHAFAHLTPTDLAAEPMGFKIGEVIDLKRAISSWANGLATSSSYSGFF
ncbi:hypothetical protein CVT24_012929, partial [Panaeolus cyanescens]